MFVQNVLACVGLLTVGTGIDSLTLAVDLGCALYTLLTRLLDLTYNLATFLGQIDAY